MIPAGTVIVEDDLGYKKPGWGIPAARAKEVAGKRAAVDISADSRIEWSMLENE